MLTDPIRHEHAELRPHVRELLDLADGVGELPLADLRDGVSRAHEFLSRHLIAHARAEDEVLYPLIGRLLGAPAATRTMSRDHEEVARLAQALGDLHGALAAGAPDARQAKALRRVLYGLHAIVELHFAKEEEVYLPLLDERLDEPAARKLFDAMSAHEAAAH